MAKGQGRRPSCVSHLSPSTRVSRAHLLLPAPPAVLSPQVTCAALAGRRAFNRVGSSRLCVPFVANYRIKTCHKVFLLPSFPPTITSMSSPSKEDLPRVADAIQQQLTSFKTDNLKHAETQEKVVLPTREDVQQEKIHNTLLHGVEHFEKEKLHHADTQEKVCLPNKQDIESEKEHKQIIEGIETFDQSKLKRAETEVKNPLPTKEVIEQEKAA